MGIVTKAISDDIVSALDDALHGMASDERAQTAEMIIRVLSQVRYMNKLFSNIERYKLLSLSAREDTIIGVRVKLTELRIGK